MKEQHNRSDAVLLRERTRRLLTGLRGPLLQLHKVLLEIERRDYERLYGRVSAGELLELAVSDARFAWLRDVFELVVGIDEMFDDAEAGEAQAQALLKQVRALLRPVENAAGFAGAYFLALQRDPAAVLAHSAVCRVLASVNIVAD